MDRELGGLPITINDLSLESGGPIPRHRSHQSGRDVDTLFYQLGPDGEPIESVGAFFDPSGRGVDFRDLADPDDDVALTLDIPRTWLFLRALIEGTAGCSPYLAGLLTRETAWATEALAKSPEVFSSRSSMSPTVKLVSPAEMSLASAA